MSLQQSLRDLALNHGVWLKEVGLRIELGTWIGLRYFDESLLEVAVFVNHPCLHFLCRLHDLRCDFLDGLIL
jgi:hypothetical protein